MVKFAARMAGAIVLLMILPLCADENMTESGLPVALTAHTGFGQMYGGYSYGLGLELEYPRTGSHHFAAVGGMGKEFGGDDFFLYSYGGRYSFGEKDRLYIDLLYGTVRVDDRFLSEIAFDGKAETIEDHTVVYGSSVIIGYQRISSFGLVFAGGLGISFDRGGWDGKTCASFSIGYRL